MFSRWQRWNCHANKLQDLKVFLLQVSTFFMGGLFSFSPWTVFIVRGKNIVEKSKINVFKSFQSECNIPGCVSVLSQSEMLWFTQVLPEEISLIALWQMGIDSWNWQNPYILLQVICANSVYEDHGEEGSWIHQLRKCSTKVSWNWYGKQFPVTFYFPGASNKYNVANSPLRLKFNFLSWPKIQLDHFWANIALAHVFFPNYKFYNFGGMREGLILLIEILVYNSCFMSSH